MNQFKMKLNENYSFMLLKQHFYEKLVQQIMQKVVVQQSKLRYVWKNHTPWDCILST